MKKLSEVMKPIKKVFNVLWIAGTILAILLIILALVINIYTMQKSNKKASVLANLSKYNASKFGYVAGEIESQKYRDVSAYITEELKSVLDGIEASEVKILKSYTVVSVLVDEPVESVDTISNALKDYADYWQIIKEGVNYYGTPVDGTISEDDIQVIEFNSADVDTFISSLDDTIKSNDKLVMFVDYDYAQVPLFGKLCTELSNVIYNAEDADKLVVELTTISELGSYTNNLDYLYSLVEKIK